MTTELQDGFIPPWAHPYYRLARLDRPIGTELLLWPCWWGIALAGTDLGLLALFVDASLGDGEAA